MADISEVLGKVVAAERTVEICVDGSIAGRVEELERRWLEAKAWDGDHNAPDTAPQIAAQLEALRAEADAATVAFKIRSIGSSAWRRLIAEHPPPDDDLDGWRWNLETFPPAALAVSCIDPAMTEAQATELVDRISDGAWQKLFTAVLEVNMRDETPKFGLGIGAAPSSGPSSTTAPLEGSLGPSS